MTIPVGRTSCLLVDSPIRFVCKLSPNYYDLLLKRLNSQFEEPFL